MAAGSGGQTSQKIKKGFGSNRIHLFPPKNFPKTCRTCRPCQQILERLGGWWCSSGRGHERGTGAPSRGPSSVHRQPVLKPRDDPVRLARVGRAGHTTAPPLARAKVGLCPSRTARAGKSSATCRPPRTHRRASRWNIWDGSHLEEGSPERLRGHFVPRWGLFLEPIAGISGHFQFILTDIASEASSIFFGGYPVAFWRPSEHPTKGFRYVKIPLPSRSG